MNIFYFKSQSDLLTFFYIICCMYLLIYQLSGRMEIGDI